MGMFDTIYNAPVKCPRCGDEGPKSAQFKCGPQLLLAYEFGKDRIKMNWTYEFYGSIIDEEKKIIRGIATCPKCREESNAKMDELIQEARDKGRLKCPEGAKYLFECEIDGKDALGVMLRKLDKVYGGNRNIELFEVAIRLDKDNIAMSVEPTGEERQKDIEERIVKRMREHRKRLGYIKEDI